MQIANKIYFYVKMQSNLYIIKLHKIYKIMWLDRRKERERNDLNNNDIILNINKIKLSTHSEYENKYYF